MKNGKTFYLLLTVAFVVGLLWSGWSPTDRLTWWLEVAPALIGYVILAATIRKFEFSKFVYLVILLHTFILMWGGNTSYAENPLFNLIRDNFQLARNYYDRVGHFVQGFVPALIVRELLIRKNVVKSRGWLLFITVAICLGFSACYEFVEWWVSLATGSKGDAFLGTQGDVWDTQWDMFLALVGSIVAQLTLAKAHDRVIASIDSKE